MANSNVIGSINNQIIVDFGNVNGIQLPNMVKFKDSTGQPFITSETAVELYKETAPYYFNSLSVLIDGVPRVSADGAVSSIGSTKFMESFNGASATLKTFQLIFESEYSIFPGFAKDFNNQDGQIVDLERRIYQMTAVVHAAATRVETEKWASMEIATSVFSKFLNKSAMSLSKLIHDAGLKQIVDEYAADVTSDVNTIGVTQASGGQDIIDLIENLVDSRCKIRIPELSVREVPASAFMVAISKNLWHKIKKVMVYEARNYRALGNVTSEVATQEVTMVVLSGKYNVIVDDNLADNTIICSQIGSLLLPIIPIKIHISPSGHDVYDKISQSWMLARRTNTFGTPVNGADGVAKDTINEDTLKPVIAVWEEFGGQIPTSGPFAELRKKTLSKILIP